MTIFCSVEMAAQIEAAERGLLAGGVAAARQRDPGGQHLAMELVGGVATWCSPGSPLNKVAGLGFAGVPTAEQLAAVEAAYRERGEGVRVELTTLGDPGIGEALTRRGYHLAGFENVLGLALPAGIPAIAGIDIAPVEKEEAETWLDVLVTGFAAPDEQGVASDEEFPREVLAKAIEDLTASSGFRRYLARIGGAIVGGACLRIDGKVAQLSGAATLPAARRRGVQSALLAHRLEKAAAAGCEIAVVTTQPGSKSQQNVQRQGFELLYSRAVLVLPLAR